VLVKYFCVRHHIPRDWTCRVRHTTAHRLLHDPL